MQFAKCEFKECDKKDVCERYTIAVGSVVNFKPICYELDYRWHVPVEVRLEEVKTEDANEDVAEEEKTLENTEKNIDKEEE